MAYSNDIIIAPQIGNDYKLFVYNKSSFISNEELLSKDPITDPDFIEIPSTGITSELSFDYVPATTGATIFSVLCLYLNQGTLDLSVITRTNSLFDSSLFEELTIRYDITQREGSQKTLLDVVFQYDSHDKLSISDAHPEFIISDFNINSLGTFKKTLRTRDISASYNKKNYLNYNKFIFNSDGTITYNGVTYYKNQIVLQSDEYFQSDPDKGGYIFKLDGTTITITYISNSFTVTLNLSEDLDIFNSIIDASIITPKLYILSSIDYILVLDNLYVFRLIGSEETTDKSTINNVAISNISEDIFPEDFDLFKRSINRNSLYISTYNILFNSFYNEYSNISTIRQVGILRDLLSKNKIEDQIYFMDNFALYNNQTTNKFEIYPYGVMGSYYLNNEYLELDVVPNKKIFSSPNSIFYNDELVDLITQEKIPFDMTNKFIYRSNIYDKGI